VKNILFVIAVILLIVSCNHINEYNRGYYLEQNPEMGDMIVLFREDTSFYRYLGSNNEKRILQKGTVMQYHYNGAVDTVRKWGPSSVIKSHVNRKISDETFILVEQKPLDSIFGEIVRVNNGLSRPNMPKLNADADKMLDDSNIKKYWIINKKTDDIYGPYSWEYYQQKRRELLIPEDLKLASDKKVSH